MNKLKVKRGVFIILILIIISLLVYNYIYKNHRNIETESPSFVITATDLIIEFTSNIEASSKKYLDKTIQISGLVTSVEKSFIEINGNVSCFFEDNVNRNELLHENILIKGRCLGFDELLEIVKIDQCIVLNKD